MVISHKTKKLITLLSENESLIVKILETLKTPKNMFLVTSGTPKTRRRREKIRIFGQNLGNFLKISLLRTPHTPPGVGGCPAILRYLEVFSTFLGIWCPMDFPLCRWSQLYSRWVNFILKETL